VVSEMPLSETRLDCSALAGSTAPQADPVYILLTIRSLSTRIVPLRFQAWGRRRRPNLHGFSLFRLWLCYLYTVLLN